MKDNGPNGDSIGLTILKQVDEVCERFEQAWQSGSVPQIEQFLVAANEEVRRPLFEQLLRLEHEYRCKAGESPARAEYVQRFPAYADAISAMLQDTATDSDTAGLSPVSPDADLSATQPLAIPAAALSE